jgi:hypothetical protein
LQAFSPCSLIRKKIKTRKLKREKVLKISKEALKVGLQSAPVKKRKLVKI